MYCSSLCYVYVYIFISKKHNHTNIWQWLIQSCGPLPLNETPMHIFVQFSSYWVYHYYTLLFYKVVRCLKKSDYIINAMILLFSEGSRIQRQISSDSMSSINSMSSACSFTSQQSAVTDIEAAKKKKKKGWVRRYVLSTVNEKINVTRQL